MAKTIKRKIIKLPPKYDKKGKQTNTKTLHIVLKKTDYFIGNPRRKKIV